jgi:hypothetical protein
MTPARCDRYGLSALPSVAAAWTTPSSPTSTGTGRFSLVPVDGLVVGTVGGREDVRVKIGFTIFDQRAIRVEKTAVNRPTGHCVSLRAGHYDGYLVAPDYC